jgi:hypothetical protein
MEHPKAINGVLIVAIAAAMASVVGSRHLASASECRVHYPEGTRCATSTVTIRYSFEDLTFRGRISSSLGFCVRGRVVVVRKALEGPDLKIGKTTTGRRGRWRVPRKDPHGNFYAVARFKERRYGIDSQDICYRARSSTILVP